MSSNYQVLCLSHDPAIVTWPEWNQPEPALVAAASPEQHEALCEHTHCDLLIGRWSGALIEIGCPGRRPGERAHSPWHRDARWIDVEWLQLLYWAQDADPGTSLVRAVERIAGCWSRDRVARLRQVLGLTFDQDGE